MRLSPISFKQRRKMTTLKVMKGDCLEKMKELEANSVDSVLCDPPYGLKFMDKAFDDLGEGRQQIDWHKGWLSEAHRVLEVNGVIRAFCGSRTVHYLTAAMAEVGFDIVGVEAWHYVNGFPKSLNISKDFDRQENNEQEIVGWTIASPKGIQAAEERTGASAGSFGGGSKKIPITKPFGENAKRWDGWQTALKPSFEPIIIGVKR